MDHKQLLASLEDDTRLLLTEKSDRAGLLMLVSHLVGVGATGVYIVLALPLWQLVMVLHGVQLVFFFTLLHEASHDTPFASIRLNRFAAWLSALVVILPPLWFRYYHLAHHRHTHDVEHDPELSGPPMDSFGRYALVVSGLPVWKFHVKTLFENATGRFNHAYLPERTRPQIIQEARMIIGLYAFLAIACIYFQTWLLVQLWLLPMVIGQPFLRLYLMAEHGRCPHVANMLENTRTTLTNRVVRWLAWNMPYHAEHHAWPSVPFHKLPEFHEVAKRHLARVENGYTEFHKEQVADLAKGRSA
jgi:fatty acid desaturase